MSEELYERLMQIAREHPHFHPRAYEFVFEALDHTIRLREEGGHVSGPELLDGIRDLALRQFGYLARTVLELWGVYKTEDFGRIVFQLVDHGLMRKTDEDSIDEFCDVFEFRQVFEDSFVPDLSEVLIENPGLSSAWYD